MVDDLPIFDETTGTGRLMAATDWSRTPIGPVEQWSETLRVLVRAVQSSRYPMLLLWGEQYTQLYNDAYSVLIGERHPDAIGNDCRVTLAEGWPVLEPIIEQAKATRRASWVPALQLMLIRAGYAEEAYFSVSHSAVPAPDGGVAGILAVCSEVTSQVLSERRLALLQQLSTRGEATATTADVATDVVHVLEQGRLDVPLAAVYLRDGGGLRRLATTHDDLPEVVHAGRADPWGLLDGLAGRAREVAVPRDVEVRGGAWEDRTQRALVLPLPSADPSAPSGVLLAGVSPSRELDAPYRSFFELLGQQVSTALRNAQAYEEERRRAEELARLDRVKTEFFTNVSHEFRTPLTLMLGPLEDALQDDGAALPGEQLARVRTAHAAAERLLKLVNDLLTFSTVQSGTVADGRRPVDVAVLTEDVCSAFRAAVERGGLAFEVVCPPGPLVVLDPEHWTTIVTNLVSNALKYTFTGRIRVELTTDRDEVRLVVADTGTGIPGDELPHLFERFHRVRGARSRSHEGSGIGLALVRELVDLAGGTVQVESEEGAGSRFTVVVPATDVGEVGAGAGPASTADRARVAPAVGEADSWFADDGTGPVPDEPASTEVLRVLVADDNADMRAHVTRLLQAEGWRVTAVPDGAAALRAAVDDPPDVLLTDVMMPEVDGFELVRAIRKDPRTRTLPVVILSARAGQGASAEGLALGADDYVVKPFTKADLLARLRSSVTLARLRSAHAQGLRDLAGIPHSFGDGQPVEHVLHVVADRIRTVLAADRTAVRLGTDGGGTLVVAAGNDDEDVPDGTAAPLSSTVRGRDGRVLGEVAAWLDPALVHRPDAHALLEAAASVLGVVLEDTRHQQRDVAVSTSLQSSLLPDLPSSVPGLELAAAYLPAAHEVEVGGDWYDVLELPDGRVLLSVGDVAGRGLDSALLMGQLRTAVRAYALESLDPGHVLHRLDALLDHLPGSAFCTMFLGYLDRGTGTLAWSNAGHPPPVLVADDEVDWLAGPVAPPIAAMMGTVPEVSTSSIGPGATLVLYTDGLVEDRDHQLDVGMPQLLALLRDHREDSPETLVRRLTSRTGRDRGPAGGDDDTAVLVVSRTPPAVPSRLRDRDRVLTLPARPEAASAARREARRELAEAGVGDDVVFELLTGLSEAVNNAVEHPVEPTRPEVRVHIQVDAEARRALLEVRDFGRWRARGSAMDRGRGAALMDSCGEVTVIRGEAGTRVLIARGL